MNNPSNLDRVPVSLDAEVASPTEDKRTYPHGQVRNRSQGAGGSDVKFQHISHIFRQICDHCVVTPIMTDLEMEKEVLLKKVAEMKQLLISVKTYASQKVHNAYRWRINYKLRHELRNEVCELKRP